MKRTQQVRAFTLIEIMVAMFLFGIVVLAVYSSWIAIARGTKSGLQAAAEAQRARMAARSLEVALTSAQAFGADIDYYSFVAENGSHPSLSFVARLPDSFPRSRKFGDYAVRRVTFSMEPAPDQGNRLVLRQNPVMMDMDKSEEDYPIVLAEHVKSFGIQCWNKKEGEYSEEWTETNTLPLKVWITLQFASKTADSSARNREDVIVALPSVMVQPGWQMPGYNGRVQRPNGIQQ